MNVGANGVAQNPIVIGLPGRSLKINTINCLYAIMPAGGPASVLQTGNIVLPNAKGCSPAPNPTDNNGKLKNVLANHTIALTLNTRYSPSLCSLRLSILNGCIAIPAPVATALSNIPNPTVCDLVALANNALGGGTKYKGSLSTLVNYLTAINELGCKTLNCKSSPLLVNFSTTASAESQSVNVYWITDADEQVDAYEVEKSEDGVHFEPISLESSKQGTGHQFYKAVDLQPVDGDNFYRLKIYQLDGTISYSEVKREEFNFPGNLGLFPNPTQDEVHAYLKRFEGRPVKISIYNSMGVLMQEFQIEQADAYPVKLKLNPDLKNGLYQVVFKADNFKWATQRLVISRF
jgi:hypothetical protein